MQQGMNEMYTGQQITNANMGWNAGFGGNAYGNGM